MKKTKYGNNPYNNRVEVDYKKKKIYFVPIGKTNITSVYLQWQFGLFFLYGLIIALPITLITIIFQTITGVSTIIGDSVIIIGTIPIIGLGQIYWNKKWRKEKFPKANYNILRTIKLISSFGFEKTKYKKIEPKSIIDNKFIVPHFSNVMIEYKLTGDFKEYLKKVKITNLFKANPKEWNCVFEFAKKINRGNMWVKYI